MKKYYKIILMTFMILSLICIVFSACSANCNGCGGHEHTWREWQKNSTEHWRECTLCGAEERESHNMLDGECTICGYKVGQHTHTWGEWQKNSTEHWRECTSGDAEERENHNISDGECTICGYIVGQHTHTWGEWQKNSTEHWRKCTSGDAEQRENHTFNGGTCEVCGYVENIIRGLVFSTAEEGSGYSVASDKSFDQTSVSIPSHYLGKPVTELDDGAFRNNKTLNSITLPNTLKKIGSSAFAGCTSLKTIDVPDSVEQIDSLTFSGCTNLTSAQLHTGLKIIKNNAFERCGLTSIRVPEGVTSIGYNAFCDCTMLSSVKFPSTLTSVSNCLTGTQFYNDTGNWDDGVLYVDGCCLAIKFVNGSSQSTINVKVGTTILADSVFSSSSINSITLPSGLKYIGEMAFNIANISQINIPNSVEKIGAKAFAGCKNLTSITGGSANYTIKDNCIIEKSTKKLIAVCKNCVIPTDGTVQTIGSGVFSNMGISSIVLPESVTTIEAGAFSFEPFGGISTIYYLGDSEKFSRISVGEDNGNFTENRVYYYSLNEPQKIQDGTAYNGRYWHYDSNTPKKWVVEN